MIDVIAVKECGLNMEWEEDNMERKWRKDVPFEELTQDEKWNKWVTESNIDVKELTANLNKPNVCKCPEEDVCHYCMYSHDKGLLWGKWCCVE
tara:strand:- start:1793 stop:2071 length:279 start_codon:yes stop_codon:yes gene_type:complete